MRTLLLGLFLGLAPGLAAALPQLDLSVDLDPASRHLAARARLSDDRDLPGFALGQEFAVRQLTVNGRPAKAEGRPRQGLLWYPLPAGARRVDIDYQGQLAPATDLDHRQVLQRQPAVAAVAGSFLPAGSGWHPLPPGHFAYRLRLRLPPGQKGVAPGELVAESDDTDGYRAEYRFPQPAEGLDLMAGPYRVAERTLKLAGGRQIRLRTWFYGDLEDLAAGYLQDSARYIERYSRLIGDYPFSMFSIVSSPTPTGFGMPGLTYLGRQVLRLPFIRGSSLGHEVLHNWWGNGVYPDWSTGNWSEGLTTFMADYAYKEEEGEVAAREMRLGWLRDLAAVPPGSDTSLRQFTSRRHGAASIVGYGKSAMVFLMLRDRIGRPAFEAGLRSFWQEYRFRSAGWNDLERVFSRATGQPLEDFFRQWVDRPGAPALGIASARQQGRRLHLALKGSDGYGLRLPLRLTGGGKSLEATAMLSGGADQLTLTIEGKPTEVTVDPDYRLWRRLDPAQFPAILREVLVAPRVSTVLAGGDDPVWRDTALTLAGQVLETPPQGLVKAMPAVGPVLILGPENELGVWLSRQGLEPPPLPAEGSARVWAGRDRNGRPYAVVTARDAGSLAATGRALPHYGRQSWLAFDGRRVTDKGIWAPQSEAVAVTRR